MVTHGPRVEPGFATTITLGGGYAPCDTLTCDLELLPQGAIGVRLGRAAGETRPGFSAGINLSASLLSSDLDVYVQAPAGATRLDAGGGVLVSLAHTMPYVQVGRMREDGSGWYTTQGFVWMARRPSTYDLFNVSPPDDPAGTGRPRSPTARGDGARRTCTSRARSARRTSTSIPPTAATRPSGWGASPCAC